MYIISAINSDDSIRYWSGSGLSSDKTRTKQYESRIEAFYAWNDAAEAFPMWDAIILEM